MRAWVLERPGPIEEGRLALRTLPDPVPAEGEVLVRVSACGLCRTDLHVCQGEIDLPRLPLVPGHQAVGTVVAGGERLSAGTRVGIAWLHRTCGACPDCLRGAENLCRAARFTGYHEHGGLSELATVPEDFAYPLPDGVDDVSIAPLLCAGIVGYRALRQADVAPGERVGLYGFGSSAHIALQVARHWGCSVYVVTRGARHRALAEEMGAAWVGDAGERPPEPLDRAVLFAPAGELVARALEAVRWGGTVASAAIHMSAIEGLDYARHLFGERTLRSTTAHTRRDGEELLALAASGVVRVRATAYPFEDVLEGLRAILEDRVQGSAVLAVAPACPSARYSSA